MYKPPIMKYTLTRFTACVIFLALSRLLLSQEKIEGFYDGKAKKFHPKVNLIQDSDLSYKCERFKEGHAVVHKFQKDSGRYPAGVIDTAGKVIVPFIYDDLEWDLFGRSRYFLFHAGDSIGVVSVSGKELLKYKRNWSRDRTRCGKRCYDDQGETGTFLTYTLNANQEFATVKINSKTGLYSLDQERFVVPVEYDCEMRESWPCELCREGHNDIVVTDRYAVCRKNGMKIAYDLTTGEKSDMYKDITVLKNKEVYLRTKEDKGMLVNDVIHPKNLVDDEVLEQFNDHVLIKRNGRVGLMDLEKTLKIPLKYDGIYFFDKQYVWVNSNSLWALADYKGKLMTDFVFLDIQNLNADYFTNFLYCTKLDTTGGTMHMKSYSPNADKKNLIKKLARNNLERINSHILFSARDGNSSSGTYAYARKADGFHRIYSNEKTVEIAEESWDTIYYIPGSHPFWGYKKGAKYGLTTTEVHYEAILFDANSSVESGKRVRKGYVYGHRIYTPDNKWEKEAKYEEYILK